MSHVRLLLSLPFLLLSSVVSSPATASVSQSTAVSTSDWKGTPGDVTLVPGDPPNQCPATAFQVLGQAWRVDFSTGGIIPDWSRAQILRGTVYEPRFAPKAPNPGIFPNLGPAKRLPTRTTVIVVDSFDPVDVRVDATAPYQRTTDAQLLTLKLRHGGLVVTHIKRLLLNDNFQLERSSDAELVFKRSSQQVAIRWVSINQAGGLPDSTQAISKRLVNAVRGAEGSNIIVHMSLALLPCEVLKSYQYRAQKRGELTPPLRYTFSTFVDDVVKEKGLSRPVVLRAMLNNLPTDEPLLDALTRARELVNTQNQTRSTDKQLQFLVVASSGNFGLEVSTQLGARDDVISVGATNWKGVAPGLPKLQNEAPEGNWSDQGNVSAVGEWFTLPSQELSEGCDPLMRFWCVASRADLRYWPHFAYRGTSFSAPSVTALLASRLPSKVTAGCLPPTKPLSRRAVDTSCF